VFEMTVKPDPMVLMAQTYALPRGPRVRLRLATPRDADSIQALAQRAGVDPTGLDISGLVRFDPRGRSVICATTLLDGGETVVGFGATELDGASAPLVLVDEELTDGLGELLDRALLGRANALQRAQAA
jgi:hypothetical protein